ncbi:MAG: hypothetical protein C0410_11260 [Anaerolinea sp.]|nr:hypothetical protein [Anaerolinea sp.]
MKEPQRSKAKNPPVTVKVTPILILVIGIMWIGFSIFIALGLHPTYSRMGGFQWIIAGMSLVPGIIFVVLWVLLRKHWKPAWYLAVIALALMTLAGIFDQIGWVDVLVMLGSAIPLVLLFIDRKWYLKT